MRLENLFASSSVQSKDRFLTVAQTSKNGLKKMPSLSQIGSSYNQNSLPKFLARKSMAPNTRSTIDLSAAPGWPQKEAL
jgi:hypothetical protein